MTAPIITLTSGHISIKRGKKIRQYLPGFVSTLRLTHLLVNTNSPVNQLRYTQRSSIYEWHGLSTLDTRQISMLKLYIAAVNRYNKSKSKMDIELQDKNCYDFQTSIYSENHGDMWYMLGIREACHVSGIHSNLIGIITPCQHGNVRDTCYTCYTTY